MRVLHLMAATYHRRPSEIVGVTDEWAAYQFDAAVLLAGLGKDDGEAAGEEPVSWDWSDLV